MIRASVASALALLPASVAAQVPDVSFLPYELRTLSPQQLAARLVGARSAVFTDAWVEGPTRRFRAITVALATTPMTSGFEGLCTVETVSTYFLARGGPSAERERARMGTGLAVDPRFVLTSDQPTFARAAADEDCTRLKPLSQDPAPTLFYVWDVRGGRSGPASSPVARFALAAVTAGQRAAGHVPVRAERCPSGFVAVPRSCGDPPAFVRSFYLRQVTGLIVERCPDRPTICVNAMVADLADDGVTDHVIVATAKTEAAETIATPAIRAVSVRAGADPVID